MKSQNEMKYLMDQYLQYGESHVVILRGDDIYCIKNQLYMAENSYIIELSYGSRCINSMDQKIN